MGTFLIQYCIPTFIVCFVYWQILSKLKQRPISGTDEARRRRMEQKRRRSNQMLISMTVTYFVAWAPLNVLNFVINIFDSSEKPLFSREEDFLKTYAICHMAGMSSACMNPILYAFLNENFKEILSNRFNFCKKSPVEV